MGGTPPAPRNLQRGGTLERHPSGGAEVNDIENIWAIFGEEGTRGNGPREK